MELVQCQRDIINEMAIKAALFSLENEVNNKKKIIFYVLFEWKEFYRCNNYFAIFHSLRFIVIIIIISPLIVIINSDVQRNITHESIWWSEKKKRNMSIFKYKHERKQLPNACAKCNFCIVKILCKEKKKKKKTNYLT